MIGKKSSPKPSVGRIVHYQQSGHVNAALIADVVDTQEEFLEDALDKEGKPVLGENGKPVQKKALRPVQHISLVVFFTKHGACGTLKEKVPFSGELKDGHWSWPRY